MNQIEDIDHDRLFKELIVNFFIEFLELFFRQLINYLDRDSITFLDKEIFTDVTAGEKYEGDLIAQVKFAGQDTYFLIHIEAQSTSKTNFNRRMFSYFARFHEKFVLPVYPIVVFSYDRPQKEASKQYEVSFPDLKVLEFNYQVIQLNRLNWRDFLNQSNPVASALMAKMRIEKKDRPKVKAECLRLLVTLKLNPAKMQLISGFIDTYLNLSHSEEILFQEEISTFIEPIQEGVMQITTSWMRQGIEQGIEQGVERGIEQGQRSLVMRLIQHKFGEVNSNLATKLENLNSVQLGALGEALLDFSSIDDLTTWLYGMNVF